MTYYMNPCRCWYHRLRFWIEARYFWLKGYCPNCGAQYDSVADFERHLNVRNGPNR